MVGSMRWQLYGGAAGAAMQVVSPRVICFTRSGCSHMRQHLSKPDSADADSPRRTGPVDEGGSAAVTTTDTWRQA